MLNSTNQESARVEFEHPANLPLPVVVKIFCEFAGSPDCQAQRNEAVFFGDLVAPVELIAEMGIVFRIQFLPPEPVITADDLCLGHIDKSFTPQAGHEEFGKGQF